MDKKSRNNKILWFFSDYNGTYDVIENNLEKLEQLFNLINEIRDTKNLDAAMFCLLSSNKCEFLKNVFKNLNDKIEKLNIPDKNKILLFSCLGTDGIMLDPLKNSCSIHKLKHFNPKAERICRIVSCSNLQSEIIYADDCPAYNLKMFNKYTSNTNINNIDNFTFLGSSNDTLSDFPNNLNIIKSDPNDFVIKGLETYLGKLHPDFNIEQIGKLIN